MVSSIEGALTFFVVSFSIVAGLTVGSVFFVVVWWVMAWLLRKLGL